MQFYQLAKGAQFEFRGNQYQKTAMSMAQDENGNGNVFQGQTEVVPIGEPLSPVSARGSQVEAV